jgi:hypothetical protein
MDSSWVDMRWREDGWREAFRIRLLGWLPEDWHESGVQKGVFELHERVPDSAVELSVRGKHLTDIDSEVVTDVTLRFMSTVLVATCFEPEWLLKPSREDGVRLAGNQMFEADYIEKLLEFIGKDAENAKNDLLSPKGGQ